jgi:uncharacterized protein YutE (UPF0331/DUF86 family)
VVDADIFAARIDALTHYLKRLHGFRPFDHARFVGDEDVHALAERFLHMAIEAAIDLANHWIAHAGLGAPESNAETFTTLERAKEIPADLAERLRGWAKFRNVLVHEYVRIDHEVSWRAIQGELGDLEALLSWAVRKAGGAGASAAQS